MQSFGTFHGYLRRGPGTPHAVMNSGHAVDGVTEEAVGDEERTSHHRRPGDHRRQRQVAADGYRDPQALVEFPARQVHAPLEGKASGGPLDLHRPASFQYATL